MKSKSTNYKPIFVPYDDENLQHTMASPDYGQIDTGSKSMAWTEVDSSEYPDFVSEIIQKIIHNKVKVVHEE